MCPTPGVSVPKFDITKSFSNSFLDLEYEILKQFFNEIQYIYIYMCVCVCVCMCVCVCVCVRLQ
jgi:hypothetical protein